MKQSSAFLFTFILAASTAIYPNDNESRDAVPSIARLFEIDDLKEMAKKNGDIQIYRLLVERAFDSPLMFELIYSRNSQTLVVKKSNREARGPRVAYTKLIKNSSLKLQEQEIKSFLAILSACSFWTLPTEEWQFPGLDGSSWTLEAIKDGKYHKLVRSNPYKGSSILTYILFEPDCEHAEKSTG
jgi:hypothetical protein